MTPRGRRDMVVIGGGSLLRGSEDFYPEEQPVRAVAVGDFIVDIHPLTNAEFQRFVKDTGHVTVAEQPPNQADFPDADPRDLGSRLAGIHAHPRGPFRSTTGGTGGVGSPGPTGATRTDPAAL